jgi:hypothetical protein
VERYAPAILAQNLSLPEEQVKAWLKRQVRRGANCGRNDFDEDQDERPASHRRIVRRGKKTLFGKAGGIKTMGKVQKKPVDYAGWERQEAGRIKVGALLTGLDLVAREYERKWGAERLRLLVSDELREKFDRQKYLLRQAQYEGTVADVEEQVRRMKNAYAALDKAARLRACSH